MRHFTFLSHKVSEIQCVFYTYSTFSFRLATFQALNGHMWLLATILDSAGLVLLSASPTGHTLSGLFSHALPSAWNMPSTTSNPHCWTNFQIRSLPPRNSPWVH